MAKASALAVSLQVLSEPMGHSRGLRWIGPSPLRYPPFLRLIVGVGFVHLRGRVPMLIHFFANGSAIAAVLAIVHRTAPGGLLRRQCSRNDGHP